jgi:hypothetical protein
VDTRRFAIGPLGIVVSAYDGFGHYQGMATNLNISNNSLTYDSTPPVAILAQPVLASAYYTDQYGFTSVGYYSFVPKIGKFTVGINATDNSGEIAKVQFIIQRYGTIEVDTPPYTIQLDAEVMAQYDPSGMVVIATAFDKAGNKNTNWSYRDIMFTDDPALLKLQSDATAAATGSSSTTTTSSGGGKGKRKK